MKINVKAFSGVFQCCWESIICSFFPARHKKFPSQLDKSSESLQPARVKMLEKVSNSQPKPLSIINFPASVSEHLYFCQPARFLWGTDKVRNRFVGCPWIITLFPAWTGCCCIERFSSISICHVRPHSQNLLEEIESGFFV